MINLFELAIFNLPFQDGQDHFDIHLGLHTHCFHTSHCTDRSRRTRHRDRFRRYRFHIDHHTDRFHKAHHRDRFHTTHYHTTRFHTVHFHRDCYRSRGC